VRLCSSLRGISQESDSKKAESDPEVDVSAQSGAMVHIHQGHVAAFWRRVPCGDSDQIGRVINLLRSFALSLSLF